MDPKDLLVLSELLDQLLDLPDDEARARWLDALAPPRDALRPELERLLAARAATGLDHGAPVTDLLATANDGRGWAAGDRVGRYRLTRPLGRGGMAVVWLADTADAPQDAPVALKFPAISLDGTAFMERFAREQRFLSALDHPGIARLVDAGVSAAGHHFLALEYVDGVPLDAYCDEHALGLRARVEVMLQVLDAVGHAHARSILHRDLKPSNILVEHGGRPRLLDFGIAKLLVDGRAQETELTQALGRAMTPDYASPEQIAGGSVGAASDIYALGVILYQLACGRRPPSAGRKSRPPWREAFVAREPPPPSLACRADAVVTRAEGGVDALSRALTGDLDAIILKCLRKNPAERYASVADLAADLARWLDHEPVLTAFARWRFRAGLLLKPHRAALAVGLVLVVALGLSRQGHAVAQALATGLTPALPAEQSVVLVTIGADDYQRVFSGTSPLDPPRLQALVARILEGEPAVVGVDIDTSAPGFADLRTAFAPARAARVVWGRGIAASDDARTLPIPRPVLGGPDLAGPWRWGLAVSIADGGDGVVRWFRRIVATSEGALPTLAEALVTGLRASPAGDAPQALRGLRYPRTERVELPASVVLADGFAWRDRIRGRVVILGGRYDAADVHPTPRGLLHGLEILAHTVETELAGRAHSRPSLAALLAVAVVDGGAALLLFRRHRRRFAVPATFFAGVGVAAGLALFGVLAAWSYSLLVAAAITASMAVLSHRVAAD
ncbi:MAG TPA: protein kinase [Caldimonas sp.]|nr:protein kinase [Caldimonas sp.]